jgi:hypothetical protein
MNTQVLASKKKITMKGIYSIIKRAGLTSPVVRNNPLKWMKMSCCNSWLKKKKKKIREGKFTPKKKNKDKTFLSDCERKKKKVLH